MCQPASAIAPQPAPRLALEDPLRPLGFDVSSGPPQPSLSADDQRFVTELIEALLALAEERRTLPPPPPGGQTPPRPVAQTSRPRGRQPPPPPDPLRALQDRADTQRQRYRQRVPRHTALTTDQAAFQAVIHRELATRTVTHFEAVRDAVIAQWNAFDRGCLIAAVTHWAREQLNSTRRSWQRIPPNPSDRTLRSLQQLAASSDPWATLFLAAYTQLRLHQVSVRLPERLSERTSSALNTLSWAFANGADLMPPIVQRRLRSLHRHLTGNVAESLRRLDDARVLGLDRIRVSGPDEPPLPAQPRLSPERELAPPPTPAATTRTTRSVGRRGTLAQQRRPSRPHQPDRSLVRVLSWLCPGVEPAQAVPQARELWRRRRTDALVSGLSRGLLVDAGRGAAPTVDNSACLLVLLPTDLRDALTGRVTTVAPANERLLDSLWCRYHDHKVSAYLMYNAAVFNPQTTAAPETRWINLLKKISDLFDGLQDNAYYDALRTASGDPGLRQAVFATDDHIIATTYPRHRPPSYDLHMPVEIPIRLSRPSRVYFGRQALGDDPGAPRGIYELQGLPTVFPNETTPAQELVTKLVQGLVGRWAMFQSRWDAIIVNPNSGLSAAERRAILAADTRRLGQYLFVARSTSIAESVRSSLLNAGTSAHPRSPQPESFLAGLFFELGMTGDPAVTRDRNELRRLLYEAIRPAWDARPLAGWTTDAWQAFLCHLFFDPNSLRRHTGVWTTEAVGDVAQLATRLRAGTAEPGSPGVCSGAVTLPAALVPPATVNDRWISSARAFLNPALNVIVELTRNVLSHAVAGTAAEQSFHTALNAFLLRRIGQQQRNAAGQPSADVSGAAEEDGGQFVQERADAGTTNTVHYHYRLVVPDEGVPAGQHFLWVRTEFKHMTTATQPTHLIAGSTGLPSIGFTGASGNAITPHTHCELTIWAQPPSPVRAREVGLLSPMDFFGPVAWEGDDATGTWPGRS